MGRVNKIMRLTDLNVYCRAFRASMLVFELTKQLPREERYSLVDQIRRSSRSVSANIAEAWGKRSYAAAFVCKLVDSEAEALETQTWLRYIVACEYACADKIRGLLRDYDTIIAMLIKMRNRPEHWVLP